MSVIFHSGKMKQVLIAQIKALRHKVLLVSSSWVKSSSKPKFTAEQVFELRKLRLKIEMQARNDLIKESFIYNFIRQKMNDGYINQIVQIL